MHLQNRVAVVTGGSSGIGRGIALALAREGARVVVADLQDEPKRGKYHEQDTVTPTVTEIERLGGEGLFVRTDVSDATSLAAMFEQVSARFHGLDILVNNAGVYLPGSIEELSVEDWDRTLGVNLRGVFLADRLAIPYLKQSSHGRILHIASVYAHGGGCGPAYTAAKAGIENMARDLALDLGRYGITVNTICPGYIETAINDVLSPAQIKWCLRTIPLGRLGRPADVANACVFLASDEAEWITGASLTVDGGMTARY